MERTRTRLTSEPDALPAWPRCTGTGLAGSCVRPEAGGVRPARMRMLVGCFFVVLAMGGVLAAIDAIRQRRTPVVPGDRGVTAQQTNWRHGMANKDTGYGRNWKKWLAPAGRRL